MSLSATTRPISETQDTTPQVTHLCREALAALDRAVGPSPGEFKKQVDEAERATVRVRDELIGQLRGEPTRDQGRRWQRALERANVAVSLLVGLEYPAAGGQLQVLKDARYVLRGLARRNLS